MKRYLEAGLLLVVALSLSPGAPLRAADEKEAAKPIRPPAVLNPGGPSAPNAPKKINDPSASVAQWLLQMTPEERERALEKFPPERQAQIRRQLAKLDSLPPQRQQRLIQEYQMLTSLPPEIRLLVRRQIQAYNQMPDDRKQVVGPVLQWLRRMPEELREDLLASDGFKSKYTPTEQQMMADLSRYWPLRPPAEQKP